MILRKQSTKGPEVIDRVRELRKLAGLSQEDLAQKAGLTRKTIWAIEASPTYAVSVPTLTKVADALGVDVTELLAGAAA